MIFNSDKAIYLQMAERLCDEIIVGTYAEGDRIPSVREYAALLEVNANTAVKAYEQLARDNIIYQRRGLGYFVATGAVDHIRDERRQTFLQEGLPRMFAQMRQLGISMQKIEEQWEEYNKKG